MLKPHSQGALIATDIPAQVVGVAQEAATWGVSVGLGMAALLCVAFLVGFVLRKM